MIPSEFAQFLENRKFPGKLLFAKVWGSRSHNCQKEDSDWDFSGVYAADIKDLLKLNPPPETIDNTEGEKPDFSFHELVKFCNLLMTGNPSILESLYTERMFISTPEWEKLKLNRNKFLTKKAVEAYIGYSKGQLRRYKHGNYLHTKGGKISEKWLYHLSRLLIDAKRIVDGGYPVVWKESGTDEHNFLMDIRYGRISDEKVAEIANERILELEERLKDCLLPDNGDAEFLNDWILSIRL